MRRKPTATAVARAICDRHTGIGADGWMLVAPPVDAEAEGTIQLYNSDGSTAEISGNGTRCAAAFLIKHGLAAGVVRVRTGAGIKTLRLIKRGGLAFEFEMNMGRPEITAEQFSIGLWGGAARLHHSVGGQPAVRRAGARLRFRLARHWRRDRKAPAFSQSHERVVYQAGGRAHNRSAVLGARGGRDDEFRHGFHRGGGGGGGAGTGADGRFAY